MIYWFKLKNFIQCNFIEFNAIFINNVIIIISSMNGAKTHSGVCNAR